MQTKHGASVPAIEPPDAVERRRVRAVVVYAVDRVPPFDAAFYDSARTGMTQVSELIVPRRDARGPDWYWNNISCGEHTGTHCDAPIHWVTGKDFRDGATDTIAVQRFVAPACVIDCSTQARKDAKFLLEPSHISCGDASEGGAGWSTPARAHRRRLGHAATGTQMVSTNRQ
jgi:Putative cyclase